MTSLKDRRREAGNLKFALKGMNRNEHELWDPDALIKKAVEEHGEKLTLGWSGGNCSTYVLHKALKINPNIDVHFGNTGIEFNKNVKYVHEIVDMWGINNFTELHPDITYWEIVKKYGLPKFRASGKSRKTKRDKTRRTPACCYYLKEKPRYQYYKENGFTGNITGLRVGEGFQRAQTIAHRGMVYSVRKNSLTVYHPIALLKKKQVEAYLIKHEVPKNPVYETQDRNGCMACTGYKGWEKNTIKENMKLYKHLQSIRGVQLMDEYIPDLAPCDLNDDED